MPEPVESNHELRIERATEGPMLEDWRHVHNVVIPTALLSAEEVRERATRNQLDVAYLDGVLVGCSTVWPPDDDGSSVVIARVLPGHRRRGIGEAIYRHAMENARALEPLNIETVVLESNPDGLHFALQHGYEEVERYVLPGDVIPFVSLKLASPRA